jgi:hypothetical protein
LYADSRNDCRSSQKTNISNYDLRASFVLIQPDQPSWLKHATKLVSWKPKGLHSPRVRYWYVESSSSLNHPSQTLDYPGQMNNPSRIKFTTVSESQSPSSNSIIMDRIILALKSRGLLQVSKASLTTWQREMIPRTF